MEISAKQVKELREKTGAGIMDCKRALAEKEGKIDDAVTFLREKGLAKAEKKAGRATAEGTVATYVHAGGKLGVMVEVKCETDFVAKTDEFQTLAKDIAMHIAAMNPLVVRREDVTEESLEKEKAIFRVQAKDAGKPDNIIEKMVEGKIKKYYKEVCLLEQPFVKDSDKTVQDLVTAAIAKLGENIQVGAFSRLVVGAATASEDSCEEASENSHEGSSSTSTGEACGA